MAIFEVPGDTGPPLAVSKPLLRAPRNKLKPAIEMFGLDPKKAKLLSEAPKSAHTGVGCTKRHEPTGVYDTAECEHFIGLNDLDGFRGGVGIVLGRDRTHSINSGYGGQGDTQAFAIRITAGYGSCNPGFFGAKGHWADTAPSGEPLLHNPSNRYDGAMIYLSQKTDVDDNFYCANGSMEGPVTGRSAIVVKADALRFISRDGGIKIIANSDTEHTGGRPTRAHTKIDFLVNNDDRDLQPLVKGDNLKNMLWMTLTYMDHIVKQIANLNKSQLLLNKKLGSHRHVLPSGMKTVIPDPIKTLAAGGVPVYYTVGEYESQFTLPGQGESSPFISTAPSTSVSIGAADHALLAGGILDQNLFNIASALQGLSRDYLNDWSDVYILSRHVNTT